MRLPVPFATAIAFAAALVVVAGVLLAIFLSLPKDDEAPAAPEPTSTPAVSAAATRQAATVTLTATPTRTPTPTVRPGATAMTSSEQILSALSGLRFVNLDVLDNPGGLDIPPPPGMPLDMVVSVSRAQTPNRVNVFLSLPPPFVSMSGATVLGDEFSEEGGAATATGAGNFGGIRATFAFVFQVNERSFSGTLSVNDASTGAPVVSFSVSE